jgi:hypothetical protein
MRVLFIVSVVAVVAVFIVVLIGWLVALVGCLHCDFGGWWMVDGRSVVSCQCKRREEEEELSVEEVEGLKV